MCACGRPIYMYVCCTLSGVAREKRIRQGVKARGTEKKRRRAQLFYLFGMCWHAYEEVCVCVCACASERVLALAVRESACLCAICVHAAISLSLTSLSSCLCVVSACASGLWTPSPLSHAAAPVVAVYSLGRWFFFSFSTCMRHSLLPIHLHLPACTLARVFVALRLSSYVFRGKREPGFPCPRRPLLTLSRFSLIRSLFLERCIARCNGGGRTPAQTNSPTASHTRLYSSKRSGSPAPSVFLAATRRRMHGLFRTHLCAPNTQ